MTTPLYDRDGITLEATEWLNCYDNSWKGLITDESFSHPAKMARGLLVRIFDHAFQHGYLWSGGKVVVTKEVLETIQSELNNGLYTW